MYSTLWVVASFVLLGSCGGSHSPISPSDTHGTTLTVCQLFADLSAYQDKIVTVRGIYYFGLRQVSCPQAFVAGNHEWPPVLDLVDSSFPVSEYEQPVRFKTDDESWNNLQLLAMTEGRSNRRGEIWATVEGQLRGPIRKTRSGPTGGVGGYGHLGGFAAELVIKRVYDVQIIHKPTFDYSQMLGPHL